MILLLTARTVLEALPEGDALPIRHSTKTPASHLLIVGLGTPCFHLRMLLLLLLCPSLVCTYEVLDMLSLVL